MKWILVLLAIDFCTIASNADDDVIRRVMFAHNGVRYETLIYASGLEKVPIWNEVNLQPPLPARKAVAQAELYLTKRFAAKQTWALERLSLEPVGKKDQWIYVIEFIQAPQGRWIMGVQSPMKIVLLMDGTVLPLKEIENKEIEEGKF